MMMKKVLKVQTPAFWSLKSIINAFLLHYYADVELYQHNESGKINSCNSYRSFRMTGNPFLVVPFVSPAPFFNGRTLYLLYDFCVFLVIRDVLLPLKRPACFRAARMKIFGLKSHHSAKR